MFTMNVYMRKVWIFYKTITIVCIRIILFAAVSVWVNSTTSPLLDLNETFLPCFILGDVNTMSIYFPFMKHCVSTIRIKIKIWEDAWCNEHQVLIYGAVIRIMYWMVFINLISLFYLLQMWILYNTQKNVTLKIKIWCAIFLSKI